MSEITLPGPPLPTTAPVKLLTRDDVATIFSVSVRTIENWVKDGIIPPSNRIEGRAYWHPDSIKYVVNCLCPAVDWDTERSKPVTAEVVSGVRHPKAGTALAKSNARDECRLTALLATE